MNLVDSSRVLLTERRTSKNQCLTRKLFDNHENSPEREKFIDKKNPTSISQNGISKVSGDNKNNCHCCCDHSSCLCNFFPLFILLSRSSTFGSISLSLRGLLKQDKLGFVKKRLAAAKMAAPAPTQKGTVLPELLTEFMVDMSCEGCVKAVKNRLQTVDGIKNVEVDLDNQVVRILGTSPVKTMAEAMEQTGRKARLIGQGSPDDFLVSSAVAEFKGPEIFGVVRFAQVNMELARVEANFSGLSPGNHGWSINEFGDLTRGAASTGKVFNPTNKTEREPLGDLGTLEVDGKGEAYFSGVKQNLLVVDLIGRSLVVYGTEDKSDSGLTAAVIARSAGVGKNYKKLCTCDGTTIWEATNSDFVTSKV